MKKLFLILAIVLLASPAFAQTWHTANQVTLAWNAVPLVQPTDAPNQYQVYTKVGATGTPQAVGSPTTATQLVVGFGAEGRYFLCVQALRFPQGETNPVVSTLSCSDVAEVTANGPFGAVYFVSPGNPMGMRFVP